MTEPTTKVPVEPRRGFGAQHVFDLMREDILSLDLPPGRVLDETQLSERYGMSRTPVREALARLASEGLIQTLPNRSTMVAPLDLANLHHFFDALTLMYRVTTRTAAQFHDDQDLARIQDRQARFAAAVHRGDDTAMIIANRDFHVAIAEAGRNPFYLTLFSKLLDEGRRILKVYYYQSFQPHDPHPYILEHESLIKAIARRDIPAADRLAKEHADQIVAQIHAIMSKDLRRDIDL